MSNFIFESPDNNLSFNFDNYDLKYQFNFKNKINKKIDELYGCYLNNNYQELNKQLQNLYNHNTIFMSDNDCHNTIKYFNKLLVIRNFIKKRIYFSTQSKNDWKIINYQDLLLTKFKACDTNIIFVPNYLNKHLYVFRISELLAIYKYSLYNCEDDFPQPLPVKNPYTGEKFTLAQNIYIYRTLLKYYCKQNKILPECFILFKNSYFNSQLFYNKYHIILHYNAINNYINSLPYDTWLFNIVEFLNNEKFFCLKCFRKYKYVRNLFNNTLQLFMLNDNGIYIYGNGLHQFIKIAKNNNLYFPDNHEFIHRRIRRVRRIIRHGRRYTPSSIQSNTPNEHIINNYISNITANIDSNIDSNIDPNIDANIDSNIDSNIDPNIDSNIDPNIDANIDTNIVANIDSNIDANTSENIALNNTIHAIVHHILYDIVDCINGHGVINSSE